MGNSSAGSIWQRWSWFLFCVWIVSNHTSPEVQTTHRSAMSDFPAVGDRSYLTAILGMKEASRNPQQRSS